MRPLHLRLLLVALTLALYGQALGFGFVDIDDGRYVTEVGPVADGLSAEGVAWAFRERQDVAWQPLTWLSHMLDFSLFGSVPAGHHATSVLLHALNALLFFELLRRTTGQLLLAAFAAVLFAWHPLRAESVAWVAERKDVLAAACALAALHAWVGWTRRGGAWRYVASLVWLALGLLAKPSVVTLPAVLLLVDHWPLARWNHVRETGRRVLEKLPHFGLALAASAATLAFQRSAMAPGAGLGWEQRLANAALAYARYLKLTLWPKDLSVHYAHPYLPESGGVAPPDAVPLLCALALLALTALAVRPGAARYLRVGWLWFLGTLVPMLGLVQVGTQAQADRYTYLPSMGLAIVLSWGGAAALHRLAPARRGLAPAAGGAACAALLLATGLHLPVWESSLTLFSQAYRVEPYNSLVNVNLGKAHADAGRLAPAFAHYEAALAVHPGWGIAHYDLAIVFSALGHLEDAEAHFRAALVAVPGHRQARGNLAAVLQLQGRRDEARAVYQEILREYPQDPVALLNLAGLERDAGHLYEAAALYRRHLEARPGDAGAWVHLAATLRGAGALDAAIDAYRQALRLAPERADAHLGLGNALGKRGELPAAAAHFRQALALRPQDAQARSNLELTLHLLEQRGAAAPATARP